MKGEAISEEKSLRVMEYWSTGVMGLRIFMVHHSNFPGSAVVFICSPGVL